MNSEYVILLHGLARSRYSMWLMEKALKRAGYSTINIGYPSTKYAISTLAEMTIPNALSNCPKHAKIHFVTHSMGGILLRHFLTQNTIHNLGNTVMLGPPNKGSEIVDKLETLPGFKFINGPAGLQLRATQDSIPNTLGPVNFTLGIIAGSRSLNPVLSSMLPYPNDGKVSVASSKVEGMSAHITLPVSHSFMMNNRQVIRQTIHFLTSGSFFE